MYKINKGVDRPPEVMGIRGMQYLTILGAGAVIMIMLTAIICGISGLTPMYGFGIYLALVMILYTKLVGLSKKHGERGYKKNQAHKRMPTLITARDSSVYKALRQSTKK